MTYKLQNLTYYFSIIVLASPLSALPDDPPSCDPASPQFRSAVENGIIVAIPPDEDERASYINEGCIIAQQEQSSAAKCITISTEIIGDAVARIIEQNIEIGGFIGPLEANVVQNAKSLSAHTLGSIILTDELSTSSTDELNNNELRQLGQSLYNLAEPRE